MGAETQWAKAEAQDKGHGFWCRTLWGGVRPTGKAGRTTVCANLEAGTQGDGASKGGDEGVGGCGGTTGEARKGTEGSELRKQNNHHMCKKITK